ncbi:MAG: hypothetical protein HQM02_12755 [Magnetococcales bacterium]|nr:hypothetical protein [Magnetococcales bacterium]
MRGALLPLRSLQDGLTNILAGRQEQLVPPCGDQEYLSLTRMINLTLRHLMHNKEERSRMAQLAFADAILLRLVKTLGQPMANISTSCQILLEEDSHVFSEFQRDMLLQIQQQAEQGRRMLTTVQEYATPSEEPARPLLLAELIHQIVTTIQQQQGQLSPLGIRIPEDLQVIGNRLTLERGLHDLIALVWHAMPANDTLFIQGRRLDKAQMQEAMESSTLRPLVWLPAECVEVVEIALPVAGEIQPILQERNTRDVASLCVPLEDGNPGICLLPGIIRQHGGAMLTDSGQEGGVRLRLWWPVRKHHQDGAELLAGEP